MKDSPSTDYDLENLVRIKTKRFELELFTTPQYQWKFTDIVFEEMTSLLIRQNVKGVNTFIDIGAHHGFYDVLVGVSNPHCKSFAFEPVPENVEIIKKNLELNGLKSSLHNVAVSENPGRFPFQISAATSQSGFIASRDVPVLKNIEVDVVKLDQFLDQIPDGPILVKIDTEGNESKVLAGMQELIEKFDDIRLVIEINPTCLELNGSSPAYLLNQLNQLDFDIFVVFDMEMKYVKYIPGTDWNEYMGERTYRNVFCTKKTHTLNVCIFNHSSTLGGAEMSLIELIDSLVADHGVIFTTILPSDGDLKSKIEDKGGAVMIIPYSWWCGNKGISSNQINDLMVNSYKNIETSLSAIETISPDIILTNTMVIPWGSLCALMLNRPHIWWVKEFGEIDHDLNFYFSFPKTIEIISESSSYIVITSNSVKKTLFQDLSPEKSTVAINNVTLPIPSDHNEKYFAYSTSTKLVIIGNIVPNKGQDDAIHAVKKLIHKKYDVELCIVGRGNSHFEDNLKTLVKVEGLESRIHFIDFIENTRPLLEQADISLMCSKNEAFGRVTAEAMLLGVPVIGTNTGGTIELIDDGINGFVYTPGNVDELMNKIAFFIENFEQIEIFGKRAQESITKKLSINNVSKVLLHFFQQYKDSENIISTQLFQLALMWRRKVNKEYQIDAQEKDKVIRSLKLRVAEKEKSMQAISLQVAQKDRSLQILVAQVGNKDQTINAILNSNSWKITSPLRMVRLLINEVQKILKKFAKQ